ncbi:MAG TPA: asparagine synthase (glutamine-hydrolyzing) [Pyrinomonadaceae bacterium]|nr:asparagine synthase (glutamine-hydrolyzing) [Pyrinomonadaceae bacterium]
MCGIAGFVAGGGAPDAAGGARLLDRMCRVIAHRGPDDQGTALVGEAALGMRRLSIIDLAGGRQPMNGCTEQLTVVFNGEVYNFAELRRDLEARGHRFRTHSDTETIVHAYEEYGPRCVEHLRGMFAFAIWDSEARELFVARDRAGKKPLYYTLTPRGSLVFGSELKCLLEHPEVGREVEPAALDAYLTFGYVPDPLSIFRGVWKLPPGSHLAFGPGGEPRVERYWDFPYGPGEAAGKVDEGELIEELRALLDEAVRVRLVADVPLGAFLSGGVDSSTVVGLMARHSSRPVKTFSIGFREDSFDELAYARLAARHFSTEHHEFVVTPEVCHHVDDLVRHFDEPFADSSALPTYVVSKMAREHVTVALSGDGGDELFAGYTRYGVDRRREKFARLPRLVRSGLMAPLSRRLPHGAPGRNFINNVALDPLDRYLDSLSVFNQLGRTALYSGAFRAALRRAGANDEGAFGDFREIAAGCPSADALDRLLYLDSRTYLPGDILVKVDRMTMAASLEARVPLLDHKLVEFVCRRIPSSLKYDGAETKAIFKRAVRGLVPDELLDRPKQGFGVPVDQWINRELRARMRETLLEQRTRERGYFDPSYVGLLLDEHARGRRDHSARLWALFVLELWHRAYADKGGARNEDAGTPAREAALPSVA